jgi:uracil-DNA glycosylase
MSNRITLVQKANGRFYLGMSPEDFRYLKSSVTLFNKCPQLNDATPFEVAEKEAIARIAAVLQKPARGSR